VDDIFKYLYQNELNTPIQMLEVGLLLSPLFTCLQILINTLRLKKKTVPMMMMG